jgi:dsRNA-specific ribonuclease
VNKYYQDISELGDRELQEKAWVGDSVLGLFAREWLLKEHGAIESDEFIQMTCNQFLSTMGTPTKIEARIGHIYEADGLSAAFNFMETELVPLYLIQKKNRKKKH